MTKKDFELIAHILKLQRENAKDRKDWQRAEIIAQIAIGFANNLIYTQPRFNRSKFLKFCEVEEQ